MRVVFLIPGQLRAFTDGAGRVTVEVTPAGTAPPAAGEALAALWRLHPGVRDRLVTEQGQVRPHVNVFVGNESIRWTGGLATPVTQGAEVSIVPAVSGG
ncbi:MAG: MoaD/ThiS family protein [Candidatus Eisenbacteria bacterium]|nr:MoaD/ThiS family protein [Candidatus Eisenbacteria bacterium]